MFVCVCITILWVSIWNTIDWVAEIADIHFLTVLETQRPQLGVRKLGFW